ncbi:MAG: hypothetical protein ACI841_004744 [Planctomycetota bacterium]|jgi:hypothetical protein
MAQELHEAQVDRLQPVPAPQHRSHPPTLAHFVRPTRCAPNMNWNPFLTSPSRRLGGSSSRTRAASLVSAQNGPRITLCALLSLIPLSAGCGGDSSAQEAESQEVLTLSPADAARDLLAAGPNLEISEELHKSIADMMAKIVRLDPTLTSDHHDRHLVANQKMMVELKSGSRELGLAAMLAYADYEGDDLAVRRSLLEVASHAAPEDARALLVHLTLEYGYHLSDRTESARLLALTSPETYLEIAHEYVTRKHKPNKTMPADEFLIRAWVIACEKMGRSAVEELADVVMNLMMEDAARHYAAEMLGDYTDALALRALETAMIESGGNGYLRRKAAQSLAKAMPRETVCELLFKTLELETDLNFQHFLRSMIDHHCGGEK